jgi:hypothetical protein
MQSNPIFMWLFKLETHGQLGVEKITKIERELEQIQSYLSMKKIILAEDNLKERRHVRKTNT